MDEAIEQLLFNQAGTHLLIFTTTTDTICSLLKGEKRSVSWRTRNPGIWANHPRNHNHLILTVKERMRIYEWQNLEELTPESGINLQFELAPGFELRNAYAA